MKRLVGVLAGYILLWYAGAMLNFFPFAGDDLGVRAIGFTGLLICAVLAFCTRAIVAEVRKSGMSAAGVDLRIEKMDQQAAEEIAERWKYDGDYAFYNMTADPEDYAEIISPEKRGERYFSVFSGSGLAGFFCVDREGTDVELGLGLRPDLTGRGLGQAFLREILRYVEERCGAETIRLSVASFNRRAIKVYERAGFVKTGTAKLPASGGMYDFTLMERRCGGKERN